jgi:transketolase C-terminal domain/subunit
VIAMENHSVIGGLGAAVAELLVGCRDRPTAGAEAL